MKILTTTLCYPTPEHPDQGIFVQRRAIALAKPSPTTTGNAREVIDLRVVSPVPWCPILRGTSLPEDQHHPLWTCYPKMISVPVIGRATDGLAYAHALGRTINMMAAAGQPPIDLIDAHFVYPDGVGAWFAGRRLGIPVVVTVRGKIVSLSRRAIRRAQIRAMLRGVDARIAVSESLAKWVHDLAGSDLPVDVIPNGIDSATHHLVDRQRARSILGWLPHARYILAVGHLQKLKGFDRILAAMPAVRAATGNVQLILAGSRRGERRFAREIRHMIDQCNKREFCVQFTGPVDSGQLNLMVNAADLTVNASRSEGWNNAISESLAAGTPVVATDVGGNGEQICSSELGSVVPDGDIPALVLAIIKALCRDWNRPLIAAHGSSRTWAHVADEIRRVFTRVLAGRHSEKAKMLSQRPRPHTRPQPAAPAMEGTS